MVQPSLSGLLIRSSTKYSRLTSVLVKWRSCHLRKSRFREVRGKNESWSVMMAATPTKQNHQNLLRRNSRTTRDSSVNFDWHSTESELLYEAVRSAKRGANSGDSDMARRAAGLWKQMWQLSGGMKGQVGVGNLKNSGFSIVK